METREKCFTHFIFNQEKTDKKPTKPRPHLGSNPAVDCLSGRVQTGVGGCEGGSGGSASNMFLRLNVFAQVCSPQWWGNYSTETETLRGPVLCVKICNSVTPELKFAAGVPVVIFTVERRSPIM